MKKIAGIIVIILAVTSSVFAKDLTGRFGAGFNSELKWKFDFTVSKYWLNQTIGLQGLAGFCFATNLTIFDVGTKVYCNFCLKKI